MTEPPGPTSPEFVAETGFSAVDQALADLRDALPGLPLAEHHDRYAAVLTILHSVLDETRQPG